LISGMLRPIPERVAISSISGRSLNGISAVPQG
jgi:hypothetical protein